MGIAAEKLTWLIGSALLGVLLAWFLFRTDKRFGAELETISPAHIFPERIAVYSTATEEILIALGEEKRIAGSVGFTVYDKRQRKPFANIGGPLDANFERLARLRPDLIIAQTKNPKLEQFADKRGIEFLRIDIESIDDVFELIHDLGDKIGCREKAASLEKKINRELDAARALSSGKPKVPCFISVDRSPGNLAQILSSGKRTFVSQMVDIAGGRNIFDDVSTRYPTVSKEALAAREPEVILEFKPNPNPDPAVAAALVSDWRSMRTIPAVESGRVHVITHDAALTPGPRMAEVIAEIANALHPRPLESSRK